MATIAANESVSHAFGNEVVLTYFAPDNGLPLFIQPRAPVLRSDLSAVLNWLATKKAAIDTCLLEAGALVFRGFPIEAISAFQKVVERYDCPDFGYLAGAAQRAQLDERVFEASAAPADWVLGMHQEMAYLPHFPSRVAFYCRSAAATGGETFLVDMRKLTERLDPEFKAEVEKRGVLYTRNFRSPTKGVGHPELDATHKTWTDAFSTIDRDKASRDWFDRTVAGQ